MGDWVKKQVEGVPLSVELDILLDLKETIKKQDLTIVGLFEDENTPLYQEYMKAGKKFFHITQKNYFGNLQVRSEILEFSLNCLN